ncbi:MAG TPA: ribonuclease HI family protein [Candidatus Saccharimonadales bacterium]|nr:ribonuclease HI family protein [Candidatus Saccharimonadales bacterium]
MAEIRIHTDGAARGNPGPAAIAYVIEIPAADIIEHAETIPATTNNQAEYQALLAALTKLNDLAPRSDEITCFADSELMVKQLNGEYKMKNAELRPHFEAIQKLKMKLEQADNLVSFVHVRREQNQRADELGNLALDGEL